MGLKQVLESQPASAVILAVTFMMVMPITVLFGFSVLRYAGALSLVAGAFLLSTYWRHIWADKIHRFLVPVAEFGIVLSCFVACSAGFGLDPAETNEEFAAKQRKYTNIYDQQNKLEKARAAAPPRIKESRAYYHATLEVKKLLKSPSTAKFPDVSEAIIKRTKPNEMSIGGHVDAQNSFGATVRSSFLCSAKFPTEDSKIINCTILD